METTINDTQFTDFAKHVYAEEKDSFIKELAQHLQSRIDSGPAQFENGQYYELRRVKRPLIQRVLYNLIEIIV